VGGRTAAQLRGMAEEAARGQREAEQAMAAQVSQPAQPAQPTKTPRPAPLTEHAALRLPGAGQAVAGSEHAQAVRAAQERAGRAEAEAASLRTQLAESASALATHQTQNAELLARVRRGSVEYSE
jgi:hypothetical protein